VLALCRQPDAHQILIVAKQKAMHKEWEHATGHLCGSPVDSVQEYLGIKALFDCCAVEHDELWVHQGFHDVSATSLGSVVPC
jgi:hypothetical protein